MAMAGEPVSMQRATRSSGRDEPSRKLKAERARSSIYLVIGAFQMPASIGLAIHAVECAVVERDVPFIAIPAIERPPVARCAPWTGGVHDAAVDAGRGQAHGTVAVKFHLCRERRPEPAECQARS